MYNGGSRSTYSRGESPRGSTYTRIGKFRIKTIYLYAGAALISLLVLLSLTSMLMGVLTSNLLAHFGVVAGALLLITNGRELLGRGHTQQRATLVHNTLVGGALVCAWISQALALFWLPALLMVALAAPLALGRSGIYLTYVQTAQNVSDRVRRVVERGVETRSN